MRVAVVSTMSAQTPWSAVTTPNHAEWCERHAATFVARCLPYHEAVADFDFLEDLLRHFDYVWCLDSDAVITNMHTTLDSLELDPGLNVCQEGLHEQCPINCGSTIWGSDWRSRELLALLTKHEPEWRKCTWIWQQWIAERLEVCPVKGLVRVHPARAFNSCHHGDRCLWQPGDFVYHPCGVPSAQRVSMIHERLKDVHR